MNEQWKELKETIVEMRDNDGTGTQQEVCKFLANLMDILEKQMQKSKSECQQDHEILRAYSDGANNALDWIYADIQNLRGCSCSNSDGIIDDVEDIIDKYKAECEEQE